MIQSSVEDAIKQYNENQLTQDIPDKEFKTPHADIETIKLNVKSETIVVDEIKPKKVKKPRRKKCQICEEMYYPDEFNDSTIHACMKMRVDNNAEYDDDNIETEPMEPKYEREFAAKSLYNLQCATYFMIETGLNSAGKHEMDGLTEKMEVMKDQYLNVFDQMYEEYGPEYIDKVLSPTILWAMLTMQNVGATFIKNKK